MTATETIQIIREAAILVGVVTANVLAIIAAMRSKSNQEKISDLHTSVAANTTNVAQINRDMIPPDAMVALIGNATGGGNGAGAGDATLGTPSNPITAAIQMPPGQSVPVTEVPKEEAGDGADTNNTSSVLI